jgi:putative hydrolase of the HAD superfamily
MRLLIWDFDGTLGYREGGAWTASLLEVAQRAVRAGVPVQAPPTYEQFHAYTRSDFPWLAPETPHPELGEPDRWWAALTPVFVRAFRGAGFAPDAAARLADEVRTTYLNPARWRRYDDVLSTLTSLAAEGWAHVILSNHVPELPDLVEHLELAPYFSRIFNSAVLGYEKPHPEAFRCTLATIGVAADGGGATVPCWMIGDSYRADIRGAEAAGLPAILVRRFHPDAQHYAATLDGVCDILGREA